MHYRYLCIIVVVSFSILSLKMVEEQRCSEITICFISKQRGQFFGVCTGTVTPNRGQGDIGPCVPRVWPVLALDLFFS